jgi:hypothetical protein
LTYSGKTSSEDDKTFNHHIRFIMLPLLLAALPTVLAGENKWGVGKLPALGWNSWNAYGCNITEAKFMSAAEKIVEFGLKARIIMQQTYQ